jgi:hypothetical protein
VRGNHVATPDLVADASSSVVATMRLADAAVATMRLADAADA